MIKSINTKLLFSLIVLFVLTSSCEDKKHQKFGSVALSFDYTKEAQVSGDTDRDSGSTDSDNKNLDIPIKPSSSFLLEKEGLKPDHITKNKNTHIFNLDSENKENNVIVSDVSAARITIGENPPASINLATQTSYQKTNLPVGSILISVELLNDLSEQLVLYQNSKSVSIIEDQIANVTFNTWFVTNQDISISSSLGSEYVAGESVEVAWTNTHSEQAVTIEFFDQSQPGNVFKSSMLVANGYTWTTTESDVRNNIGVRVKSTLLQLDGSEVSDEVCCFNME